MPEILGQTGHKGVSKTQSVQNLNTNHTLPRQFRSALRTTTKVKCRWKSMGNGKLSPTVTKTPVPMVTKLGVVIPPLCIISLRSIWCPPPQPPIGALKILKNKKNTRCGNFTTNPHSIHLKRRVSILACGAGDGCNQLCQISTRSVQVFRSPRWPKIAISH